MPRSVQRTAAWLKIARETALFLLGATGFIHELLVTGVERPYILAGSLALMGLPFAIRAANNRNGK